jgi:predicted glycogen debranching enzyme
MFLYQADTHGELHPFLHQEWLLSSGHGAFASSSVVGCNTRRYHGLLCAATAPPLGRVLALSRLGEIVHVDGREDFHELSICQFRQSFHPRGDKLLRHFRLGAMAQWEFEVEGVSIIKQLVVHPGRNAIALRYRLTGTAGRKVVLRLLPFVALRDFHALRHKDNAAFATQVQPRSVSVTEGPHTLQLAADTGEFQPAGEWWYGHTYAVETERGLDDHEDLFVPAHLLAQLTLPAELTLRVALGEDPVSLSSPDEAAAAQKQRYDQPGASAEILRLRRAAADFIVPRRSPEGNAAVSILAGYPWFADWGRDAMISLPGLLLTTGRHAEALAALDLYAQHVSQGMIPNHFDDYTNQPSYNTVDASLWFIHACFAYLRTTGDEAGFRGRLLPACQAIRDGYRQGTRFDIRMDADGLITAGNPDTQLTWMDARCDGVSFTPRHGKAVEINALWYNALKLLGDEELAARVRESFVRTFWINPFRGLFDCVHDQHVDASVRPNQIFAVSLPHSPLEPAQQSAVVETVRRELLTPYGLRTLSRNHPNYHGRYTGPQFQRDRAYHNGTVWSWLIGPFLEAYLRIHGHSADAQRQARVWLQPLLDHMHKACLGQISEIFEGDEPHRPVGCPAQAWSVAEVLRIAVMLGM